MGGSVTAPVGGEPTDRAHIEAYEPHHLRSPDLLDKGHAHSSAGLLGSVVVALFSVAPASVLGSC